MDAITALHTAQARTQPNRDFMLNMKKNESNGKMNITGSNGNTSIQCSPRGRRVHRPGQPDSVRPIVLERRKSTSEHQHDIEQGLSDDIQHDTTEKVPKIYLHSYTTDIWEVDMDIVDLRQLINSSFRQQWDKGIQAYIKGDWQKARDIFHETVKLPGGSEDGPSKFLINLIDNNGGTKPANWQEYRQEGSGH